MLSLCAFISGIKAIEELDISTQNVDDAENAQDNARGAAGWIIFVAFMVILIESLIVVSRFLNISLMMAKITIFMVVVSAKLFMLRPRASCALRVASP